MKYVAIDKVDNDILLRGDECATNQSELYKALVDKMTTEIEIRKSFADKFFTYSSLCDFVEHAAAIAPHITVTVQDVVYDNLSQAVKAIMTLRSTDDFIYAMESNPNFVLGTIHSLCRFYNDVHDEQSVANNKIASLAVQVDDVNRAMAKLKARNEVLQKDNHELTAKLTSMVNRANFRYEKTINPDELMVAKSNNYNRILYIKEITRVHYVDTLVYYLQEIMRTLYGVPVRSVAIEPYYAYTRAEMYNNYVPHWQLRYSDVYSGNIFMAGYQPKVMTDVLQNANRVNFLIVLDRGGYMVPHIDCRNVSYIYTASDLKDVPEKIKKEDVISYSEATLNIPYIEDFDELSPEQRIQKYSTMAVCKRLINALEEV